jgi:hypothetical protein
VLGVAGVVVGGTDDGGPWWAKFGRWMWCFDGDWYGIDKYYGRCDIYGHLIDTSFWLQVPKKVFDANTRVSADGVLQTVLY